MTANEIVSYIGSMNEQEQDFLKHILDKDIESLTPRDKSVLRARWEYVGKRSRAKFEEAVFGKELEGKTEEVEKKEESPEEESTSTHPADETPSEPDQEETNDQEEDDGEVE